MGEWDRAPVPKQWAGLSIVWRHARHNRISATEPRIAMTDQDAVLAANLEFYRAFCGA